MGLHPTTISPSIVRGEKFLKDCLKVRNPTEIVAGAADGLGRAKEIRISDLWPM